MINQISRTLVTRTSEEKNIFKILFRWSAQFISTNLHWTIDKVKIKNYVVSLPPFTVEKEIYGGVSLSLCCCCLFFLFCFFFLHFLTFFPKLLLVYNTFMWFYTNTNTYIPFHAMEPFGVALTVAIVRSFVQIVSQTFLSCFGWLLL